MKARTKSKQKLELGIGALILTAFVLVIIAYFFRDAYQIPFGTFGSIIWFFVLAVSFFFGLFFFSQYLLPLRGTEGWIEGFNLLWQHYTSPISAQLQPRPQPGRSGRRVKSAPPPPDPYLAGLPRSFTTVRAGILRSHQVLALAKGSGFSRPVGPGFVRLYPKEVPIRLFDLRNHTRRQAITAHTRDGIRVETKVSVTFRIRQSPLDYVDDTVLYPYDRDAIFQVAYSNSISTEGLRLWKERLSPQAAAMVMTELAKYNLNDLVYEGGAIPLNAIKQEVKRELEPVAERDGLEILSVGVSALKYPKDVINQRIHTWQAEWQRQIKVQRAAGEAEGERRKRRARARAQIEIIEKITQNIQAMRRTDDANLTDIIMLRMIKALEEAASYESVRAMIPKEIMNNLVEGASERMQKLIRPPQEE